MGPSSMHNGNSLQQTPAPQRITVRVPATSANVGVGFDVLGLALDLTATFMFSPSSQLQISGCAPKWQGPDNLVWTSYQAACRQLDAEPTPLCIGIYSPIPSSGGLGSSSTCVVAGIAAAQVLHGSGYDKEAALDLATRLEGHPDNVAPAIRGGLVSSFVEGDQTCALRWNVAPNLRFVCMAPPYQVLTSEARKVLPQSVPLQTATWQMGRCVAMVQALMKGDAQLAGRCCEDRLHEPYRSKLIPDYQRLRQTSLDAGASAFVISGSGSTMLAITDGDESAARVAEAVDGTVPGMWVRTLRANTFGTSVQVEKD